MSEFTKSAFEASLLSVVVYNDDISKDSDFNDITAALSDELSETEINYFVDNFEIVDTTGFDNSTWDITELADSGYQGMLIKRKGSDDDGSGGEYWFVNRGTEASLSGWEGNLQDLMVADIDLALTGAASLQIGAMETYFKKMLKEEIPDGATLYSAGHSLGGHLTTYLTDAHESQIDHAFTFNGAGIDKLPDSESEFANFMEELADTVTITEVFDTLNNLLTQSFQSNVGSDKISNFVTDEGLEVIPSTNSLLGEIYRVTTEEGGHGSGNLAHSLFVHHTISELDSSLSLDDIGQILNQSSNTGVIEHDSLINGLSEIFGEGAVGEPSESSSNDSSKEGELSEYHDNLSQVASQFGDQGFTLTPLDSLSSSDLMDQLNADTTQGAVARYSVLNNLSFLVEGDFSDVTPSFMDNEAYTDPSQYSEAFWADKLEALALMLSRNSEDGDNGDVSEPGETIYDDRLGEDEVYGDGVSEVWYPRADEAELDADNTQQVVFGTHDDDPVETGTEDDRVYGLDGMDTIKTFEGNDQVEAGAGNDEVYGGAGIDSLDGGSGEDELYGGDGIDLIYGGDGDDRALEGDAGADYIQGGTGGDTLEGGGGNDILEGGEDGDLYVFEDGEGLDVINGEDHSGDEISLNGERLTGTTLEFRDGGSVHEDGAGNRFAKTETGLTITTQAGKTVVIENFSDGDFGMSLQSGEQDSPEVPDIGDYANEVYGDFEPIDFDKTEEGVQKKYDEFGNVRTDPDKPSAREDELNGSDGGNDLISGGEKSDLLKGKGGDDHLLGGAGNDRLFGQQDNDLVEGGDGTDLISGGSGEDFLVAGNAEDTSAIMASTEGSGNDTRDWLSGHGEDDVLVGSTGQNGLAGGDGEDRIYAGGGDDYLFGDENYFTSDSEWEANHNGGTVTFSPVGPAEMPYDYGAADKLYAGHGDDHVWAGAGDDQVFGESGEDELMGELGNDFLSGGGDDDDIFGDSGEIPTDDHGNDVLSGGEGNDDLYGQGGDDTLIGGSGDDDLVGDDIDDKLGNDLLVGGSGSDDVWGGGKDDTILGGTGADYLYGDARELAGEQHGSDLIDGGDAKDEIVGGGGSDVLIGGGGNDNIAGDSQSSFLSEDYHGDDVIQAGEGDDTVFGNGGNDSVEGGDGNDKLHGDGPSIGVDHQGDDTLSGGKGEDTLWGYGGDDVLRGGQDKDELYGDLPDGPGGDDTLDGGAGGDVLVGYGGRDSLLGGAGEDHLDGGTGDDRLVGGHGGDDLFAGKGNDTAHGGSDGDFVVGGAGMDQLYGESGKDTIYGDGPSAPLSEHGDDEIFGGSERDKLFGGGGDDRIHGGTGRDTLSGGNGTDRLWGDDGHDNLYGGAGDDYLYGGAGSDFLSGGLGNNELSGGTGDDTYAIQYGSFATINDSADGGYSSNTLQFGNGITTGMVSLGIGSLKIQLGDDGGEVHIEDFDQDNVFSNVVIDKFVFEDGTEWSYEDLISLGFDLDGTDQADTIEGTNVVDRLHGYEGDDTILAKEGDDELYGDAGSDTLKGMEGDDLLDGGSGADTMQGGTGDDTYRVENTGDQVVEATDEGEDTVESSLDYSLGENVENLVLNGAATTGSGNELDNTLTGNGLDNTLHGRDGADSLEGNGGDDQLHGGAGNDDLYGNSGNDHLDGGQGVDRMEGGAGDDVYQVSDSSDEVIESAYGGFDRVNSADDYQLATNIEALTLTGDEDLTGTGNNQDNELEGNSGNNTLNGQAGNDSLNGGEGQDTLDGGSGSDAMAGGSGDDTYYVDNDNDEVIESVNGGHDTVYSSIDHTLDDNVEDLTLTGSGSLDATGNQLDNTLRGNEGSNRLDGAEGADTMIGGEGHDYYEVDNTNDTIVESTGYRGGFDRVYSTADYTLADGTENLYMEGAAVYGAGNEDGNYIGGNDEDNTIQGSGGDDRLRGKSGNDSLSGNSGEDRLYGGSGDDELEGGSGDDFLDGGAGSDGLRGGAGDDTYYLDDADDTIQESASEGYDTVRSRVTHTLSDHVEALELEGWDSVDGTGNNLDNSIEGNRNANTLSGLGGDDYIDGGDGVDTMVGGAGNDTFIVGDEDDTIVEEANEGYDAVESSVSYTLSDHVEELELTGSGDNSGTGNGLDNDIDGNNAGNSLSGLGGDDTIDGYSGNDTLTGGDGADYIYGGDDAEAPQNDDDRPRLRSEAAAYNDFASYDYGGDYGGPSDEVVLENSDTLDGGAGNDHLDGGSGDDTLYGGEGDDYLYGGDDGGLFLDGGDDYGGDYGGPIIPPQSTSGSLSYSREAGGNSLNLYEPIAQEPIILSNNDLLYGGSGQDTIDGGSGSDRLYGGADADTLQGGDGNDRLDGGDGIDHMEGGSGDDVYFVDGYSETTDIPGDGDDDGDQPDSDDCQQELLTPMPKFAHPGKGGGKKGNEGVGNGQDAPPPGHDKNYNDGPGTSPGNPGRKGKKAGHPGLGQGTDKQTTDADQRVTSDATSDSMEDSTTTSQDETTLSTTRDAGSTTDDTAQDTDGKTITTFVTDTITENGFGGYDKVYADITYTLSDHLEQLSLTGTDDIDATGNDQSNSLYGNSGDNTLNGKAGYDSLRGREGNDTYVLEDTGDDVYEEAGNGSDTVISHHDYALKSHFENLTLAGEATEGEGNSLANTIQGNQGNNVLRGGLGDDTLNGAGGNDALMGGEGNDSYLLHRDAGVDVIQDQQGTNKVLFAEGIGFDSVVIRETTDENGAAAAQLRLLDEHGTEIPDQGFDWGLDSETPVLDTFEFADGSNNSFEDLFVTQSEIQGDDSAESIDGGRDDETIDALGGNDTVHAGIGNDTVDAGAGDDIVYGEGGHDTLEGGSGTDHLLGGGGDDTLEGGLNNDVLYGGHGSDTYQVEQGTGHDLVAETTCEDEDATDTILFDDGVDKSQLWFSENGGNLTVSVLGSQDKVSVHDWFGQENTVEQFETADGSVLSHDKVQQLVDAMASKQPKPNGSLNLPPHEQETIDNLIASSWDSESSAAG